MTDQQNRNATAPEEHTPSTAEPAGETPTAALQADIPPEVQAKVKPAREALQAKLREIKTPEDAQRIVDEIMAASEGVTEPEVHEQEEETAGESPEREIERTAAALGPEQTARVLMAAARQIAGSSGEIREALEMATQEATNPEQEGIADESLQRPANMLRAAMLRRMKPLQAMDARIFLWINHMPHTKVSNKLIQSATNFMNGGWGWVILLLAASAVDRPRGIKALHQVVPPLWFATMSVEFPIKHYFRRRRPFIDVVQAVAVGRKPGGYSFPSGHSAAAFAGAWLMRRHYPELTPLWYSIATLVAFSRMYLGVHYPGDVVSGALSGTVIAEATRWFIDHADETAETHPATRAFRRVFE
jgi:undecaprenyl-diphosphatase